MKRIAQLGFTQNGWSAELGRMQNGKAVFDTKVEASWDELDYILEVVRQWVETGTVDFVGEAEESKDSGLSFEAELVLFREYGYRFCSEVFEFPSKEAQTHWGVHIKEKTLSPAGYFDYRIRQTKLFPISSLGGSALCDAIDYGRMMASLANSVSRQELERIAA